MDTVKMNPPMPEANQCPQCGTPLPVGALDGLCPACLLKMGAAADTVTDTKSPPFHPPSVAELAPLFPQLEIHELVGKGGMGAVYKARQKQLDRIVALKILPPGIGDDPAFAERFAREAKALAKLNHPNIVTLYEFGDAGRQFYFLMEFVDGVNLRQLLQAGRISAREALAIVPQICDALQFAHDLGIVHRDIKPENILLDRRGRVKVADFGLAKIVGNDGRADLPVSQWNEAAQQHRPTNDLTDAGKVMGTPQYMSPEQIQAPGEVDHRADIYALGVVFYQMLTGELPGKKIEAPSKKVQIDVRLDEIVLRALEKNPMLRYQQVSEVKTCVETIVAGPDSSRPSSAMLKSERARLAVQEAPGANVNYPAMGEVALYADRLVISSGYNQRSIPLTDIRGLGEAVMPFWFSPGAHRYASVAFDEAGQRRHLVFLAGSSVFRLPGDTQLHAAEWLTAIQRAVKSASGCEVPITQVPTVVPVKTWWTLLWLAVPLVAFLPLLAKFLLVPQREPAGFSLLDVVLFSGTFLLVPALALFVVYIARSISLRHTGLKPTGGDVIGAHISPVKPHFSRSAIVGVCLAVLALVLFVFSYIVDGLEIINPVFDYELTSKALAALGLLCLLISTVFGWIAVSQVRRSSGKIYGLWLAVFDGLLFPLLTLDALIIVWLNRPSGSGFSLPYNPAINESLICLFIIAGDALIIRRVWRAVNKTVAAPAPSVQRPARMKRKIVWILCTLWAAILLINVFQWWSKYEPDGVWLPSPMDASVSGEYGEALLHVTEVSQIGQVVVVKLACDTPYPERGLYVQYSGQIFDYPADVVSLATNVDCLISPRFMDAGVSQLLVGTDLLKGKPVYRIGFVLPDAATAAKVVEQIKQVHLGKPRGLDQNNSSLLLFSLYRYVGKKIGGEVVTEGLDAMLDWQPKQNSDANSKPIATQNLSFAPVMERTLIDSKNSFENEVERTNAMIMINFDTGSLLSGSQAMWDADTDAQKHWMQTNGVDAFCVVSGVGGLMGLDMKTVPVSSQAWDEVSTAMLNQLVGSPRQEMVSLTLPLPTAYALQNAKEAATPTWLFQTREGAMGVLQITGFTVNPRGVKIRYKLLQNGGTTSIRDDTTLLPAMYSLQDSSNQERVRFTYVIASGDTVARIAHKFGMSITALKALNPDLVPNRIRIGQQITVTEPISAQLQNPMTVTNHVASLGNPPAAPNLSFGPMLERTIYNDKTGKDWLLNLESGETFSLPPGLTWEKNFSTVLEWLHLHGIHLMGFTVFGQNWHDGDPVPATVVLDQHYGMPEASTRGLYGFEMEATIMQSPGLTFESITPLEISNALQKLVVPAKGNNIGPFLPQFAGMAWHDAKWQGTDDYLYAFQTDDGQSGVLQITGFTVNPRGVKIRYKLLQNGNGKN